MLYSINLSLSSLCGANCIYCPSDRWLGINAKTMSFEIAKQIVNQISDPVFLSKHNIKRFELWENGDVFKNKEAIKIISYIKEVLPNIQNEIYTNFENFNYEKIDVVLKNNLIDSIYCNIDSTNPESYKWIKGLNFNNTINNLLDFIKLREKYNSKLWLHIKILPYKKYIDIIVKNYGFYPTKIKKHNSELYFNDLEQTKHMLEKYIDPTIDSISESDVFWRAERKSFIDKEIDYSSLECPYLYRVEEEAFIAPDWTWYACCFDAKNTLILWNVIASSIDEIFESKKRSDLIEKLKNKKFKEIGSPCDTVNCCVNLY